MFTPFLLALLQATSAETHIVQSGFVTDEKAVFATVESVDVVSARARIGGVIGELRVDEGDAVAAEVPGLPNLRHWRNPCVMKKH